MAWHLPPSPAKHPDLQLSASLCNTTLLGKDAFGVEGEKKDDPGVFTTTFPLSVSFAPAWHSPDFGNAGCVPSGGAVQSNTRGVRAEPELFSLCSHRA